MTNIKNDYLFLRNQAIKSDKSMHVISESNLEFYAFAFKINENHSYLNDLIFNWSNLSRVTNSSLLAKHTAEQVINSEIQDNAHYFQKIDKIYEKNKNSPSYITMKTMGYLKDNNSDKAISVRIKLLQISII